MIGKLTGFFLRRSKRTVTVIAILLTLVLGLLDYQTGVEIHFLLLYLVPIFLAAWLVSCRIGVYIALLASLIWFAADSLGGSSYSTPWITYWNLGMRTGVFVLFGVTQSLLRAQFDGLSQLAARDFLTGLPNGRAFYELAAGEMERAFGLEPMTLVSIDLSGLQWVNDRLGYPAGDQMLCTIANTIRQQVPRPDLVGRVGGTSFAALLPNTNSDAANLILQQVQNSLHAERRKHAHPLTFHISAVACAKAPRTVAELMQQAESQMTRMKGGKQDSFQIAKVEEMPALQ
ncbi:MAG: GGDEF domain-containing protein [Candidatus Binatia bacterium]